MSIEIKQPEPIPKSSFMAILKGLYAVNGPNFLCTKRGEMVFDSVSSLEDYCLDHNNLPDTIVLTYFWEGLESRLALLLRNTNKWNTNGIVIPPLFVNGFDLFKYKIPGYHLNYNWSDANHRRQMDKMCQRLNSQAKAMKGYSNHGSYVTLSTF